MQYNLDIIKTVIVVKMKPQQDYQQQKEQLQVYVNQQSMQQKTEKL